MESNLSLLEEVRVLVEEEEATDSLDPVVVEEADSPKNTARERVKSAVVDSRK